MNSLPTLDVTEMHDADALDRVLVDWKIDSMQLGKGELLAHSERLVFPDLVVERSRQNLTKRDEYQIPPGTTVFCLFKPGSTAGQWCGFEVPENVLLLLALAGGSLGGIIGMLRAKHKTSKTVFQLRFGLILLLQVAIVAGLYRLL